MKRWPDGLFLVTLFIVIVALMAQEAVRRRSLNCKPSVAMVGNSR